VSAEHSLRTSHHRQPRRVSSHWGTDGTLHYPSADPATCPTCRSCPTCNGQGEVSPNPHAASTPALILTNCPDCGGTGERGAS
jgi:DnaJ-class molecular chaperone